MAAILKPFFCFRFNYTFDSFKNEDGPYLVLCNHTTDLDPLYLYYAAGRYVRFVASEHIMRKGLGTAFLTRYCRPIVHTKGAASGMRSAMEILKALKAGDSVALFPEGNRCFNGTTGEIPAVTGKLARTCGAKVITYRLEGGYLTQPRWGFSTRRGKVRGHLVHVYSPEELSSMSAEEVLSAIRRDLYEDAYASQELSLTHYRGRSLAEGLETAIFACPVCKRFGQLTAVKDRVSCSCGFFARMDGSGFLHDAEGNKLTVKVLDALQQGLLAQRIKEAPQRLLFSDKVHIRAIGEAHTVASEQDTMLTAYPDTVEACGKAIPFSAIEGAAIRSRNTLNVFLNGGNQYEITGGKHFCGLKYLYAYRLFRKEALF